jgi:microcin C transport system ATP-binding protein
VAALIDASGITKTFVSSRRRPVVTALSGVSIQVKAGETLGLVGESGSGKSTLLRIVAGLEAADEGRLEVAGHHVDPTSLRRPAETRRILQMVFQDPYGPMNPLRTVQDFLHEGWEMSRRPLDIRASTVDEALESVGLSHRFLHRMPRELSGGQAQRVSIARTLLVEPQVLLLDEPTSALDVSVQAQILKLLRDIQDRLKLSYVLVTHDLGAASVLSHHIAVMRSGQIEELGTAEQIIGHPKSEYATRLVRSAREMEKE